MTEPTDYSTWTYDDHLAQAEKLAAAADGAASAAGAPSQAAHQRESIRQTTARGQLHVALAELKKPEPPASEPARPARQRADKPAGS